MTAVKTRDIPITVVRMPPELRLRLAREASINARSLNLEIINRLQDSFTSATGVAEASPPGSAQRPLILESPHASYATASKLSDTERLLLSLFASLPPEKQLALLTFIKK